MRTILVIDDREDNLALLEVMLGTHGYAFLGAKGGEAGLAIVRECCPDLVLLDLGMPGRDGFTVLASLRADPNTRKLPIIVLTASYRSAPMIERGFDLGATEYLTKPIQMDELLVRIRSALRLAEAERELDGLRRDYASMLAHDMRAPLDGVRLAVATLQQLGELDPTRRELLDLALASLDEVNVLVEDLLQVNRLEDQSFVADLGPVDVSELAQAAVRGLRTIADDRGLALVLDVAPGTSRALADAHLVKRLSQNLLVNALKFTEAGVVTLRLGGEEDHVVLEVADTGPGIEPDVLPHIFDRYFHLGRRRVKRQDGLGLGLAFCQRAVAVMGGTIAVDSKPGVGTCFRVKLRAAG